MQVYYSDSKLAKLCTNEREMQRKRADIAPRLKLRIKALDVAQNVGELATIDPLGDWHELTANWAGHWAGKLSANYRLVIRPEGASETWEAVTVTVIEITDYHQRR
ncbi:MAG: type II toxin-antitoxin system RelE/ParE family toxin [Aeromicrobium sp.]